MTPSRPWLWPAAPAAETELELAEEEAGLPAAEVAAVDAELLLLVAPLAEELECEATWSVAVDEPVSEAVAEVWEALLDALAPVEEEEEAVGVATARKSSALRAHGFTYYHYATHQRSQCPAQKWMH
jgi:hypothetical protein